MGVELELDVFDVDVYEKYEKEAKEVDRRVNHSPEAEKYKTNADKLRFQCSVVKDFFDAVFGPGTAEKLFHGRNNIKDCNDAYLAVIEASWAAMDEYNTDTTRKYEELGTKYAPVEDHQTQPIVYHTSPSNINMNRAQRRNSKKKKRR
jgi:hypothetical protein